MRVRGFYRDIILLSVFLSLIFVSVVTLYQYYTTGDETSLYLGFALVGLIVFVAFARYRFVVDYIGTLWKKWK